MNELSTGLILAVGGAGLLAALAFRQLTETVIQLNRELKETIQNNSAERENLKDQLDQIEQELDDCQDEVQNLKQKTIRFE